MADSPVYLIPRSHGSTLPLHVGIADRLRSIADDIENGKVLASSVICVGIPAGCYNTPWWHFIGAGQPTWIAQGALHHVISAMPLDADPEGDSQ